MAALVVLCLLLARAPSSRHRRRPLAGAALLLGLVIWMHPSWHLFLLPVGGVPPRPALRRRVALGCCGLLLGVLVAGLLYGNPLEFVDAERPAHGPRVRHAGTAGDARHRVPPRRRIADARPRCRRAPAVARLAASGRPRRSTTPVFALSLLGWLLGWLVIRFWSDWGAIALLVWMALELERVLERGRRSWLLAAGGARRGGRGGRPARALGERARIAARSAGAVLSLAHRGGGGPYLPDPGGVLYTDDMRLFFQVFYARPTAPWRYIVGYEPALMPPDDLATFRASSPRGPRRTSRPGSTR